MRVVREYDLEKVKLAYTDIKNTDVKIYFDITNKKDYTELEQFILTENKKFLNILYVVLKNNYIDTLYKRESKSVSTMKFKDNKRIYCKEIFKDGKKIVMISFFHKKVQRNQSSEQLLNLIKKIETYEYKF